MAARLMAGGTAAGAGLASCLPHAASFQPEEQRLSIPESETYSQQTERHSEELKEQHHLEDLEAAAQLAAVPEEAAAPEVAPFLIYVGSYYEPRFNSVTVGP